MSYGPITLIVFAAVLLAAPTTAAQNAECERDADALSELLRTDYSGRGLLDDLERTAALDSVVALAPQVPDAAACDRLLHSATALFPDGHLGVEAETPSERVREGVRLFSPWSGETGVQFVGDSAAVVRVRSFDLSVASVIDSVITAHAKRLAATPYLVIDVTTNGGGGDAAFAPLLPFVLTGPVRLVGAEIVATEGNRASVVDVAAADEVDGETRMFLLGLAERMGNAVPGAFIPMLEDHESVIAPDSVTALPRMVAVLTDAGTASSAEEFVLVARQSARVIIVGAATYGALDYSNVRGVMLPSGTRAVGLPMTRRSWLPETSIDAAGIAPDMYVPTGTKDWTAFALGVLFGRDAVLDRE